MSMTCPFCKSEKCLRGDFSDADPDGGFLGRFFPRDVTYFVATPSVKLKSPDGFTACIECGCIWNFVDPDSLRKLLKKHGLKPGEVPEKKSVVVHYTVWLSLIGLTAAAIFFAISQSKI
jgi:hypothetical protein